MPTRCPPKGLAWWPPPAPSEPLMTSESRRGRPPRAAELAPPTPSTRPAGVSTTPPPAGTHAVQHDAFRGWRSQRKGCSRACSPGARAAGYRLGRSCNRSSNSWCCTSQPAPHCWPPLLVAANPPAGSDLPAHRTGDHACPAHSRRAAAGLDHRHHHARARRRLAAGDADGLYALTDSPHPLAINTPTFAVRRRIRRGRPRHSTGDPPACVAHLYAGRADADPRRRGRRRAKRLFGDPRHEMHSRSAPWTPTRYQDPIAPAATGSPRWVAPTTSARRSRRLAHGS